jgi:hypothetical protein
LTNIAFDESSFLWHKSNGPCFGGHWYLHQRMHRYYGPAAWAAWFIHGAEIKSVSVNGWIR